MEHFFGFLFLCYPTNVLEQLKEEGEGGAGEDCEQTKSQRL